MKAIDFNPTEKPTKRKTKIYPFHIILIDTDPLIWRRFQVPSDITFRKLHEVIQNVMGWTSSHLYQFEKGKNRVEDPIEAEDIMPSPYETMSNETKLSEYLKDEEGAIIEYTYDFGDGWEHLIKLEKVLEKEKGKKYPNCLDGEMNCPPEDCGGALRYCELVKIIQNPDHEEHKEITNWLGANFDPTRFDVERVNKQLTKSSRLRLIQAKKSYPSSKRI